MACPCRGSDHVRGALLALNRVSLVVTPREGARTVHTPSPQTPPPVERGDDMRTAETETRPLPPRA